MTARVRGDFPPRTERPSETIESWPYFCVSFPKLRNFICYTQQLLRFQAKKTQAKRATQIRKRAAERETGSRFARGWFGSTARSTCASSHGWPGPACAVAGTRGWPHGGPRSTACSTTGGRPWHKEVGVPQDKKGH